MSILTSYKRAHGLGSAKDEILTYACAATNPGCIWYGTPTISSTR